MKWLGTCGFYPISLAVDFFLGYPGSLTLVIQGRDEEDRRGFLEQEMFCVRSSESQGDAANEGPLLTLQALVPADALLSQR